MFRSFVAAKYIFNATVITFLTVGEFFLLLPVGVFVKLAIIIHIQLSSPVISYDMSKI